MHIQRRLNSIALNCITIKICSLTAALFFVSTLSAADLGYSNDTLVLDKKIYDSVDYVSHNQGPGSYIAQNINSSPVASLKTQIESITNLKLKARGEAHITILTPPEINILSKYIKYSELEKIAKEMGVQNSNFKSLCAGIGEKTAGTDTMKTFFIVVESKTLLLYRQQIQKIYDSRRSNTGSSSDTEASFEANTFYPHITIGFTHQDLHLQDGVKKDSSSCRFKFLLSNNQ